MAEPTVAAQLQARIAKLNEEIARVKAEALLQEQRLLAEKGPIEQALAVVSRNPEIETLVPRLRAAGVL